jgi:cobalt-zinc-cadmium efflux system protein
MHPHSNQPLERRFLFSMGLTLVILFAEVIGGYWTGSLALLSDSAHVFMDLFALGLSFIALRLSALPADDRHTYGYHRLEVLAALANGLTLFVIAAGIFWEAWQRWQSPEPIKSAEMFAIAVVGLIVNVIVAFVLGGHDHDHAAAENDREDVNVKSAFLHVLGDAVSSVGVILAAILIWRTGWQWVDPLTSVLIGVIILLSSGRVLKSSVHILVEGAPERLSVTRLGAALAAAPDVIEVHDLHVWSLCSTHVALSAHIVVAEPSLGDSGVILAELKRRLLAFGIEHTTIQLECVTCGQGPVTAPLPLVTNVTPAA